ncbi:MAG: HDOD domain-containing protein [Methylococcaceae bacterium]|nr:HDOD domain-containing protein [Methylococcaceae bacterium]
MPIFSRTVQALNEAIEDRRSGVLELSRIILEDPTLTAKILKLSNTPYYNPGRQKLATVTRAIVLIGLQVVRDLALACVFIESLLAAHNREQVRRHIAHALHAAVQAKSIAIMANDPEPEEIFIAALLHNIGHIVFWCFAEKQGEELATLIDHGLPQDQAERQVLGFRLRQLGAALSRRWKLGGLLDEVFAATHSGGRPELVRLGCELAENAEGGWQNPSAQAAIRRIAELPQREHDELLAKLELNARNTVKLAAQFGAGDCTPYLPIFPSAGPRGDESGATAPGELAPEAEKDGTRLVQVLHDISVLLAADSTPKLTIVLELVLEGCYRTLGMDRVLLALMDPGRKLVRDTAALGWSGERPLLLEPISSVPPSLVSHALEQSQAIWIKTPEAPPYAALYTPAIIRQLGRQECLIAPIGLTRRIIGLIYADRAMTGRPLRQDDFDGFRQLTMQANIAFKLCQ